ncbi:MAG: archaetidylserine decarboxylase [Pseudomonadales bacterium]
MSQLFILLQQLLPQHLLSRLIGKLANSQWAPFKNLLIRSFVHIFGVDLGEASDPDPHAYASFNAFFTRSLRQGIRPVSGSICSPADGTVSMTGHLSGNQLIQAKGISYSLEKLLGSNPTSAFENGSFITIYLSPRDYHRFHLPVAGALLSAHYIPGKLFSVNATTTEHLPDLFANNERLVTLFETATGPVSLIMVGAMIVAGIKPVWRDTAYPARQSVRESFDQPQQFDQGAEIGHFEMGSTVILLHPDKLEFTVNPGEHVKMGEPLVSSLPTVA